MAEKFTVKELEKLTLVRVKEIAKKLGIKGYSNKRKNDIITFIIDFQKKVKSKKTKSGSLSEGINPINIDKVFNVVNEYNNEFQNLKGENKLTILRLNDLDKSLENDLKKIKTSDKILQSNTSLNKIYVNLKNNIRTALDDIKFSFDEEQEEEQEEVKVSKGKHKRPPFGSPAKYEFSEEYGKSKPKFGSPGEYEFSEEYGYVLPKTKKTSKSISKKLYKNPYPNGTRIKVVGKSVYKGLTGTVQSFNPIKKYATVILDTNQVPKQIHVTRLNKIDETM